MHIKLGSLLYFIGIIWIGMNLMLLVFPIDLLNNNVNALKLLKE